MNLIKMIESFLNWVIRIVFLNKSLKKVENDIDILARKTLEIIQALEGFKEKNSLFSIENERKNLLN